MEYAVQMGPMLLIGALAILGDLVTGLAGSLAVGAVVWLVTSVPVGMIGMSVIGGGGGALAILGQRLLWRVPLSVRSGTIR